MADKFSCIVSKLLWDERTDGKSGLGLKYHHIYVVNQNWLQSLSLAGKDVETAILGTTF